MTPDPANTYVIQRTDSKQFLFVQPGEGVYAFEWVDHPDNAALFTSSVVDQFLAHLTDSVQHVAAGAGLVKLLIEDAQLQANIMGREPLPPMPREQQGVDRQPAAPSDPHAIQRQDTMEYLNFPTDGTTKALWVKDINSAVLFEGSEMAREFMSELSDILGGQVELLAVSFKET